MCRGICSFLSHQPFIILTVINNPGPAGSQELFWFGLKCITSFCLFLSLSINPLYEAPLFFKNAPLGTMNLIRYFFFFPFLWLFLMLIYFDEKGLGKIIYNHEESTCGFPSTKFMCCIEFWTTFSKGRWLWGDIAVCQIHLKETYFYLFLFSSVMSRFQALHSLVKKLSNANSHSDIRKYGHAIVSQIGSSKDRRKRITSEEMRAIIEEKDAAITLVKIIMKIIHLSFCDKEFWKCFGHDSSSCISIYHLKFLPFEAMSQ